MLQPCHRSGAWLPFILELLQNAEDARASKVRIELGQTELVVEHDGRPFSPADVRGICGVGVSTDQAAVPDPELFLDCLREGVDEVLALA